ncbi:hypothetical protein ABZ901_29415 [Actinacidiphila alni]|uniref:hypothetical protein n=1 Tax=Actinacidiphila alni TaxID=380248 RepID=UPI003402948D
MTPTSGAQGPEEPGLSPADREAVARVRELAGRGYIGPERARAIVAVAPEARDRVLEWLGGFARAGDWRSFEKFANLAVDTHPEGLAAVVAPVVAGGTAGVNHEDLVEILGEAAAGDADPAAVAALHSLLVARLPAAAPPYALLLKIVHALGAIGGGRAEEILRSVAVGEHPKPLKWEAAVELGIEDDLGFDEDEMTR